ncbi:hypothetical protein LTR66_011488 [Elasticomyces elasticus]|nr:hypothetical protein LTR66_011488 [Elasticomyces elasticus]KAK5004883.1 hypothetical protein LTR28_008360 [Elasticomyces elasticus]
MRVAILSAVAALSALTLAINVPGLPACAGTCVGSNLGGCQQIDVACICKNTGYIQSLSCCVAQSCSPADQENDEDIQEEGLLTRWRPATIKFAAGICSGQGVVVPSSATCASTASSTATSAASSSSSSVATPVPQGSASSSLSSVLSSVASAVSSASSAAASMSSAGMSSASSAAAAATSSTKTTAMMSTSSHSTAAAASQTVNAGAYLGAGEMGVGLGAVAAGVLALL